MIRKASFKPFYHEYPQRPILGPVRFNLFINDLLFFIKEAALANFAYDSTMYVGSNDLTELLEILRKEYETVINWFKTNNMIVNPDKFQSLIISSKKRPKQICIKYKWHTINHGIICQIIRYRHS